MNRLFVGTFLDAKERAYVQSIMDLNKHLPEAWGRTVRFVAIEKRHLTWMFLGECKKEDQGYICSILHKMASNTEPYEIEYDRFDIWPNERSPRVGVLASSNPPAPFVDLVYKLQAQLKPFVLDPTSKHSEYNPHVTVARFKGKSFKVSDFDDAGLLPLRQRITEVSLIRSHLHVYEAIESFKLK